MSILFEFLKFIFARRKYWLIPIFLILLVFASLLLLTSGSPVVTPLIYTVF